MVEDTCQFMSGVSKLLNDPKGRKLLFELAKKHKERE